MCSCRRWCLIAAEKTGHHAEKTTDGETEAEAGTVEGKLAEVAEQACTAGADETGQELVSQTAWMGMQPEAAAQQHVGTKLGY